jgi:hypothetical protein
MKSTTGIQIKQFINEPWREIGLDAEKRGLEICHRSDVHHPDAYLAVLIGMFDIIREIKEEKKEAKP